MLTAACYALILGSVGQCPPGGCPTGYSFAPSYGYATPAYAPAYVPAYGYGYAAPASYGYGGYYAAASYHPALMAGGCAGGSCATATPYGYGYAAAPMYTYATAPVYSAPIYAYASPAPETSAYSAPTFAAMPVRRGLFGGFGGGGGGFHPFRRLFGGGMRRGFFRGGCG